MTDTTATHQETMLTKMGTEYATTAAAPVPVRQTAPAGNAKEETETDKNEVLICEANRK